MEMDKVAVIGFTASGKTTYALGMYNKMSLGVGSFSLREKNEDQDYYLSTLWDNILDGEWPHPSDNKSVYNFTLCHNFHPVIGFDWLDYPGAVVVDPSHECREDFRKQLSEASCLLVLINGESFAYDGSPKKMIRIQATDPQEYKHIVHRNLERNKDLKAISALTSLGMDGVVLPPTAIVVTKSDLIEDQWVSYVSEIIKDNFAPIFGKGSADERVVMLSAVTLGNNITAGDVDPVDIEHPIAFAVLSILRRRIQLQRLLREEAQGKLNEAEAGWLHSIFHGDKITRLKKEIGETDASIQKMIKDAHFLLDLFPLEKPIYINDERQDLRSFFANELNRGNFCVSQR